MTAEDGTKYWIIKNSWDETHMGHAGFFGFRPLFLLHELPCTLKGKKESDVRQEPGEAGDHIVWEMPTVDAQAIQAASNSGDGESISLPAPLAANDAGELKLKLFSPGNITGVSFASAIGGNWYTVNNAAGDPSCKLTGEEAIKTSHHERLKISNLADEEAMKEEALKARHKQWMEECKRTYKNEAEKARHFEIFQANVEFIEKINAEQDEKYGPRKNVIASPSATGGAANCLSTAAAAAPTQGTVRRTKTLFSPVNIVGVSIASAGNWYIAGNHEAIKKCHNENLNISKLTDEEAMKVRHEEWMKWCKRTYKDEAAKTRRFGIFKANVEFIEKYNAEQEEKYGPRKNVIGTNGFTDWTREEYFLRSRMLTWLFLPKLKNILK
uniref:Cathepsin propeptide inhibitor domain-containing protein n=1 Tax=Oryza punctata TaxID=4537 RepID=A0A0E0LGC2_ORYPU